jgi:two-component system response regulator (stage 0 sporulation protein F)
MMMAYKVLVVDDEPSFRDVLSDFLESKGYNVREAYNGEHALESFKKYSPNVVLMDVRMPGKDGIETLREMKTLDPKVCVIMVSAVRDERVIKQAKAEGAFEYITKPINPYLLEHLLISVERKNCSDN